MHDSVCTKKIRPETHLAIGKVLKPWGLAGTVKIYSYAESVESFLRLSALYVRGEEGTLLLSLEHAKAHKKAVLLKFKGRDCIEDVEELAGRTLYIDKEDLPPLEEGEYYWFELIGMEVRTDTGKLVGTLERIMNTGSHDVYVVRQGEQETLVPAVPDVIQEVDTAARKVIIQAVKGLLTEDEV
jgi:16S rRNA processing protein RimM